MHLIGQGKFFSKLRNFVIYDSTGSVIGKVGDLLLRKEDLSVYSIISHDSSIRERLEAMHIIDDRDEIIPLYKIDREKQLPNQIHTTVERHQLKSTNSRWEVPEEYFLLSQLQQALVVDSDGDSIGKITDIIYHQHDDYSIVIDPASYIEHFLEALNLRHHHEIIIPGKYIESLSLDIIQLNIDRMEIEKIDALPIHAILEKNRKEFTAQEASLQKRYHYYVLQAPLQEIQKRLHSKGKQIADARSRLKIVELDGTDPSQVEVFTTLFNEVAMTSVDPYEKLDPQSVREYFQSGSYLAYYLNKPIGYCITTTEDEGTTGVIAGIGIHHKHRGKRFSSALMAEVLEILDRAGVEFVQCDVLRNNEASLGLFQGLGFRQIDDFYLS